MEIPAVSVVIPMYNVEKFIGECLKSLLAQTFKNFEVIVVDDCSTDSSAAIVRSYVKKFSGRLQLSCMKKNSGGAGFPRNKGVELARGEYVYFFDPDDSITPTALAELYSHAKNFNADVVHCEKWYQVPDEFWKDASYRKNLKPYSWPAGDKIFITKPTLLTENFAQRAIDFSKRWLNWNVWQQMIRRKFIVDNEIKFGDFTSQDMVFTICALCSAKKYLVVPNIIYFYRQREGSAMHPQTDLNKFLRREFKTLKSGTKYLDEYLSGTENFSRRPDLKYLLADMFTSEIFNHLIPMYSQVPPHVLDEILRREFGENSALEAFIFNMVNIQRLRSMEADYKFNQFAAQAKARIAELERENDQLKSKEKILCQSTSEENLNQIICPPNKLSCPAVSVVIPMYNVEKYIGECLESLLAQTFKNFEVIVVDDCSTDSSAEIVQSYAEKFSGRLRLSRMKKNSGGAGFPRNKGVELSRGEYIYFIDPDDAITSTALKELYTHAKNFDADVVHCEKLYEVPDNKWHDLDYIKHLKPYSWPAGDKIFITKPTLLTENFAQRAVDFSKRWLTWCTGLLFIRRDFIVNNEIKFGDFISEDMIFTICVVCSAKRYLVVPNVVYFYRQREGSIMHSRPNIKQLLQRELKSLRGGIKYLDKYLSDTEIFSRRPDLKYLLTEIFVSEILNHLIPMYSQVPPPKLDEILRQEFSSDDNPAFSAFIFSAMNIHRLNLMNATRRIAELESEVYRVR